MENKREVMQDVILAKRVLNAACRRYRITENIKNSYVKDYTYVPMDIRLARHANDSYGGISDCYIMYAVAKLGFADIGSIQKFLWALKRTNPNLNIMDVSDRGNLRTRLSSLYRNGFLFKSSYEIPDRVKGGENKCIIYSIDHDSQNFMTQKLGKRVPPNKWIQAKPLEEIIAWAACSHVGTLMAQNRNFVEFKEGIFRTKAIGTVMLNNELKMENSAEYYVITIPAFLYYSKERWSEKDFVENILYKINVIYNYINYKTYNSKNPRIVIVVEDIEDMEKFKNYIVNTEVLLPYLEIIFFTGEEYLKSNPTEMLQLKKMDRENYGFVTVAPDFLN